LNNFIGIINCCVLRLSIVLPRSELRELLQILDIDALRAGLQRFNASWRDPDPASASVLYKKRALEV